MNAIERLLRLYPASWRDRYGDELLALVEDDLDGRRPGLRLLGSLASGALRERARAAALAGTAASGERRARAGGALVLWAGAAFVVAAAVLGKVAEQAGGARTLAALRPLAAVTGGLLVAALAVGARPAARYLATGGWAAVGRQLWRAVVTATVTAFATVGLVAWAHHLPASARQDAAWPYATAFLAWGCAVAATVAAWTSVATALVRHVPVDGRRLGIEARLAQGLVVGMWAMTAVTVAWWATGPRAPAAWLAVVVAAMVAADAIGGYGAHRCRTT
jgi:hypothetical protein